MIHFTLFSSEARYSEVKTEDFDDEVEKLKRLYPEAIAAQFGGYELLAKIPVLDLSAHYKFRKSLDSDQVRLEVDGELTPLSWGYLSDKYLTIMSSWMTHETMRGLDPYNRPFIARKTYEKEVQGSPNSRRRPFHSKVEVLHPRAKCGDGDRPPEKKEWGKADWGNSCVIS